MQQNFQIVKWLDLDQVTLFYEFLAQEIIFIHPK
jgi:hypothetical protein